MAKDDIEIPDRPPAKRRQLEAALDLWLAVWLAKPDLTPSERRRCEEERARRKALVPAHPVAIIVGPEGTTKQQRDAVYDQLPASTTSLELLTISPAFGRAGLPTDWHEDSREAIQAAKFVIVAPRNAGQDNPLWGAVRYAKHRRLPVVVVLPDGSVA